MGFFKMMQDWSAVKKQKEGFLAALKETPVGRGISISDPANPITARALIEILRDHPNAYEMMDYGVKVTLMRKVGMIQSISKESHDKLTGNFNILTADGVVALGLHKGHELPPKQFRNGVPDDYNGTEAQVNVAIKEK